MTKASTSYYKRQYKKIMKKLPFEEWPPTLIKRILFQEADNTCEVCGYQYTDPQTGKGPFQIHHRDGNRNNWNRENLQVLCLNCHWKTPNFAFRNRKHTKETKKKLASVRIEQGQIPTFHEKYKNVI